MKNRERQKKEKEKKTDRDIKQISSGAFKKDVAASITRLEHLQ